MAKHFGGDWTEKKLNIIEKYLERYLTALKNQREYFKLGYIDAFAGDGSIQVQTSPQITHSLFHDRLETVDPEIAGLIRGSAERAILLNPGFDTYVLIENDPKAIKRLLELKGNYSEKEILIKKGDANKHLRDLCDKDWRKNRAVVFLDPTGMQVHWETMVALADTKAVDVWIWFPIGVAVNRLLTRDGKFASGWEDKLNDIFGTLEWKDAFYREVVSRNLFSQESEKSLKKIANFSAIAAFYNDRLKSIFPAVASNPRMMTNSRKNPIYLLCFACANERGTKLALRIAQHLLNKA